MGARLVLLEIPGHFQADLVIGATVLFLVFATCGLMAGSVGQPSFGSARAAEALPSFTARAWRSPLRALIIAGLLSGLVVLALSGC